MGFVPADKDVEVIISMSHLYRIFFLYLEPLSTIVGAFYASILPNTYLELTHAPSAPSFASTVPVSTSVVLTQLANLYFLFALNEGLVLRSTNDVRVWKTLLFGLLVADFGHLYSVYGLGVHKYCQVWGWNAMDGKRPLQGSPRSSSLLQTISVLSYHPSRTQCGDSREKS